MKTLKFSTLFTALIFYLTIPVMAQDVFIDAKEASKQIKADKSIVVVSTRPAADYQKVHVPGAVHIDLASLYTNQPVKAMLNTPAEIAKVLGEAGIGNDTKVFIYDDGSGKYSGRFYWILDYVGAKNVSIIDGGMKGWRMGRLPVTKNPSTITPATFTPKVDASKLATLKQVKSAIGNTGYVIVDVRSPEEYKGTAQTSLRPGHVPGAINLPYDQVLNDNGTIKSADELKTIFASAGITSDKRTILYCETSVRAGIVYVALRKVLSYPNVMVFDGAYTQWQSDASNKVEAD